MERTEQMYTLQKQLEFGKKKVRSCGSGGGNPSGKPGLGCWMQAASKGCSKAMPVSPTLGVQGLHLCPPPAPWKILSKTHAVCPSQLTLEALQVHFQP